MKPKSSNQNLGSNYVSSGWFRHSSVGTKLNFALILSSCLALTGIGSSVLILDRSLKQQASIQAQSELATLGNVYQNQLVKPGDELGLIAAAKSGQSTPMANSILTNEAIRLKVEFALLVNKDKKIIISSANPQRVGAVFDPNGLTAKAMTLKQTLVSNELIDSANLRLESNRPTEAPNLLINYTIKPLFDQNQNVVGAIILGNVINGKTVIVDTVNKALGGGYAAIATADAFVVSSLVENNQPLLRPTLSLELVKRDLIAPSQQAIAEWEKAGGTNYAPLAFTKTLISEITVNGKEYTLSVAPIINAAGEPIAVLIRGTSHDRLKSLLIAMGSLGLGIGLVAIGAGFLLARSITTTVTKSIQELESTAQQYGAGNLNIKAEVESQDEIGELAQVFNQMIATIRANKSEQANVQAQVEVQGQVLEIEVGHLLDVVSDLESGNLTIQAAVSDQATGLVADTLNRLIEQLVTTISSVFNTAQQVTQGAEALEKLATSVADNAELQAQSVTQATDQIDNINQLATTASAEAIAADIAVQSAQNAVNQGQQEITKLTSSIALLQQGTTQIVQRLKTLGEFVDLAKQFVQDQKRLSSLTQVVAMNASMIAARATEQREPDQFASVAREFEAIASQVNNLATQTNQGLIVLQQRTGFIEIVVSGINQDVKDVSDSVNEFTIGVGQSSQAFNDIKNVTEQVAQLGRTVAESSQAIATAVKSSFASIQEISALAEKSATQAELTREQSVDMGQLARQLLHDVHFFRLPPDKMAQNSLGTGQTRK